jgi:hypothetical protein
MSSEHDREQPGSAGEDAAVARAWRQASDEQPPARLDGEILAAAHRAVRVDEAGAKTVPVPPRARRRWMQWQPLAAAATVAGLAFVLVQTLPREREVAPPIRMEAPAPAPGPTPAQAPTPAPDAALETRSSAPPGAVTETPASPGTGQTVRDRGAESAARSPATEVDADVADRIRDARIDERRGVTTEASGDAYSAQAPAPATARAPSAGALPSAADWTARIEALHASGDLADAADALRAFRAADPDADAYLPDSLREWARAVE